MFFDTPILFLIFNRPDTTRRVFEEIKKQRPKYLFVAADGPRLNIPGEIDRCQQTRDIIKEVDWECEIKTLFQEKNLGCGQAVSGAITWFFENVEEGIILEDDCLPEPSFFTFCEELLQKYRDNDKVGVISGDNFLFNKFEIKDSYYFSQFSHIWGWATWRRVWQKYDFDMKEWSRLRNENWLKKVFDKKTAQYYWQTIFDDVHSGKINTWDYQLTFACFLNDYLSVMPKENLISNIGFGGIGSTHTKHKGGKFSNMSTHPIVFPLVCPDKIFQNKKADYYIQKKNFCWWKLFIKKSKPGKFLLNILKR
ncbi:MAG: hypothetical protein WA057_01880 [Candidatus Magasanikiibacteriota bacterium]